MMRFLKQVLFIALITVCASFAAMAQQDRDGKKVPPKDDRRPKVIVKDKEEKPKEDRPRNDNRGNDNRGRRPGE